MLENEQPAPSETLTAAQIRVTPEELSQALAVLEARQEEEVRRREEDA